MPGMSPTGEYRNIHGRRPGRGVRPWLLVPKIVGAAVLLGGLVSLLVLVFARSQPTDASDWARHADLIRRAFTQVIVPALIATLLIGLLLALAHPGIFLRMRWLQAKLATMAVFVPTLHFYMSRRSVALGHAITRDDFATAEALREQLFRGTVAAVAFVLIVIVLGRLKPRLGQHYGRTFGRKDEA